MENKESKNRLSLFENRMLEHYLSVKEVSKLFGVPEKTVRNWVYKKILSPIKLGPRLIRFKKSDIEKWVSQQQGDTNGNK